MKRILFLSVLVFTLLTLLMLIPASAEGKESPPTIWQSEIFGDYMVIQRNEPIRIFGYANHDGMKISATLGETSGNCVSENGRFEIVLPASEATTDLTLTVTAEGGNSLRYRSVDIGEVWLLAGQSNMAFPLSEAEDAKEYLALADFYPHIRCFTQTRDFSFFPQTETTDGKWQVSGSSSVGNFSAIGYMMATVLADELEVPVGIVTGCANSTSIQAWLNWDSVSAYPSLVSSYESSFHEMAMATFLTENCKSVPSAAYNRMLAPLVGYTMKGVLWYQGESNSGTSNYAELFSTLMDQFRRDFVQPDMPFFVFQLAPYCSAKNELRFVQYDFARSLQNVYLISTADDGATLTSKDMTMGKSLSFVHPTRKSAVALRCADSILANVYEKEERSNLTYPKLVSSFFDGSSLTLVFDSELYLASGNRLTGFSLLCSGAWITPESAVVNGKTVTLKASSGKTVTGVRYGSDSICFELESGELVSNPSYTYDEENPPTNSVTFTIGGIERTFNVGTSGIVRSTSGGNLTNASGVPLPSFRLYSN